MLEFRAMNDPLGIPDEKRAAKGRGFEDRFLLIATALLIAGLLSGSFFFAALYHVNKWFVLGAWNSIILAPRFIRDFRGHLSNYSFVAFLFAWLAIHGSLVAALLRWTTIVVAISVLFVELAVGAFLADVVFGVRPEKNQNERSAGC